MGGDSEEGLLSPPPPVPCTSQTQKGTGIEAPGPVPRLQPHSLSHQERGSWVLLHRDLPGLEVRKGLRDNSQSPPPGPPPAPWALPRLCGPRSQPRTPWAPQRAEPLRPMPSAPGGQAGPRTQAAGSRLETRNSCRVRPALALRPLLPSGIRIKYVALSAPTFLFCSPHSPHVTHYCPLLFISVAPFALTPLLGSPAPINSALSIPHNKIKGSSYLPGGPELACLLVSYPCTCASSVSASGWGRAAKES